MAIGKPANGGKNNNEAEQNDSIEKLEQDFAQYHAEIKKIITSKDDRRNFTPEEQRELRTKYLKMSNLAKKLSEICSNEEKAEKYKDAYNKLFQKAQSYGSAIKQSSHRTKLEDVKGLENVKELVRTFLYMAQHQDIMKAYKMDGGLGLLMYGAPGTGKTMIAEAIASEMNLPLFVVTPADLFKSYVGESEAAVRQLFQEIESCEEGSILFVDECDSIFSKRSSDAKDYKAAVTTELLQRINGFGVDGSKRILIGATNLPWNIDDAYLRYKRFSYKIHVTPPDAVAIKAIIEGKLKGIDLGELSIDNIMCMIMDRAEGNYYSSADVCGLVEEACRVAIEKLVATQSDKPIPLSREMFEHAINKVPPSITAKKLELYNKFGRGELTEQDLRNV